MGATERVVDPMHDDELMTVQSFANLYRVDASVVRSWVKRGVIRGTLVGPRMLRVRRSDILQPARPTNATTAIDVLVHRDGMDRDVAADVVAGLSVAELAALIDGTGGHNGHK